MAEHNFSLNYNIDIDGLGQNIGASITSSLSGDPKIGQEIYFYGAGWIDASAYGMIDPVKTFSWLDIDGVEIGTGQDFTYIPSAIGNDVVQLKVNFDDGNVEEDAYFNIAFQVIDIVRFNLDFNFGYDVIMSGLHYANMDIHRYLSLFPLWSSANRHYYSNTSKLLSPLFEQTSHRLDGIDSYFENNVSSGALHFGYREDLFSIITIDTPSMIRSEHGYLEYIGEEGSASLESSPVRSVIKKESYPYSKESHLVSEEVSDLLFMFPNILYVSSASASYENPQTVRLIGMNELGERVQESFVLISTLPIETINQYKMIYSVKTESKDLLISNWIDLTSMHSSHNGLNLQKRITNTSGFYFEPEFRVEDRSLMVLNGNRLAKMEEYKFDFNSEPSHVYINNLLDVMYLDGTTLCASKLMLDYYDIGSDNSSTNNNGFIFLDNEFTSVSDSCQVTINIDKIRNELLSKGIRVSIENEGTKVYLDSSAQLLESSDTWLDLSNATSRMIFSVPIENNKPYTFRLELDNKSSIFIAMNHINEIKSFKILEDIVDLFVQNKQLWCEDSIGDIHILEPIRLSYTSSINKIHLFNNFENLEFIS
jgi:hypothetical protein